MALSKTAFKVLKTLGDGKFHSGEALGEQLNMTRSAIWKALQQFKQYDIHVESITGKGYRLNPPLELLDREIISSYLTTETKKALEELFLFTELDSTSNYLLDLAKDSLTRQAACLAEHQTHGRGRRGRLWVAPFGTNIYLSMLWQFKKDPSEIAGLSLAIAVALAKALKQYGISDHITLKWPNDILWKNRKLVGVLLEMIAKSHEHCSLVIGLGLNTQMPKHAAKNISQPWVDISEITQIQPERNRLVALILNELVKCNRLFQEKGLSPFLTEWRSLDNMIGEKVVLHTPEGEIQGTMQDISERGELILLKENKEKQYFFSGEVSLRIHKD